MAGKGVKQQEQGPQQVRLHRPAATPPAGRRAATVQQVQPYGQDRPVAAGAIRDPLGNFSEAVGAYFG
jgi:hypothetical protein